MSDAGRVLEFGTSDGLTLTAEVWADGEPSTVPVVLLHGLSQQRRFWGPVVRRLRSTPIAGLDQRGHGDSDTPLTADYSVEACADDVVRLLDELQWPRAVVVGHSWGGSVALRAGARHADRVSALVLIDGGLWSPRALGDRAQSRERLTPPPLGIPAEDLWARIREGYAGGVSPEETIEALTPTFRQDEEGRLHSRIGLERHMKVLDGLLDVDPANDLELCADADVPLWAAVCEPAGTGEEAWIGLKGTAAAAAAVWPNVLIHRWSGAIHDVPLQWPDLVAGFIDSAVASAPREGGRT